ncbi:MULTISPECIES: hypothetical protein [Methylosinus]|uniref:Uncharacterized protein n=1 Tax=Methylosinus sporium TaxID=428 RepID=A0A2U1SRR6_METSR|nr:MULTISPECIES: hypothetical protein [Methylosinus]MBU3890053.1 hypothetical protein [Methylosinus sp. KRF6]PWB94302.1 hypothetical protein C5689_08225 [Methylosinus sporium]TRL36094.1 hypothetical protein FM996_06130 [Methylosinus sporium]
MAEEEPSIESFGHGLGPRRVESPRKRSLHIEREGIAKYGHGLGPRPAPPPRPETPVGDSLHLASEQAWPLAVALIALGAISIGIFTLAQTIDRQICSADPRRDCERGSDAGGGGGGGGSGAGGSGFHAHYGGFGGSGGFYSGGS